jgi:hypothetical protein
LAINDGRLVLGDGGKMRLDVDPFPVNTIGCEEQKILVRTDQVDTTQGKNVIVSDELWNRMIKPHNPEVGVWKENTLRKPEQRVKPTTDMLMEKYVRQRQEQARAHIREGKRPRSPCYYKNSGFSMSSVSWHSKGQKACIHNQEKW